MIVTPLLCFFGNYAESLYKRTPHPTLENSEKQGLACLFKYLDSHGKASFPRRILPWGLIAEKKLCP